MVVDLVLQHWNDFLTVILAIATLIIGIHQVRHYRAWSSDLEVSEIYSGTYKAQKGNGGYLIRGESGDIRPSEGTSDDIENAYYSIELLAEVNGREPTTILNTSLILSDTGEEIELSTKKGVTDKLVQTPMRLKGNDGEEIKYFGHGEARENYTDEISGILRFKTTTGVANESVVLSPSEPDG